MSAMTAAKLGTPEIISSRVAPTTASLPERTIDLPSSRAVAPTTTPAQNREYARLLDSGMLELPFSHSRIANVLLVERMGPGETLGSRIGDARPIAEVTQNMRAGNYTGQAILVWNDGSTTSFSSFPFTVLAQPLTPGQLARN